jgi:surface protein
MEPEEFIQEKTYNDLRNPLENKSAAKKEIKRRNEIFRDIVTTFLKKQISDIGDESVEYLSSISNTNSEEIIRFIERKESSIDSKIKTPLRKAKEEQPEFYKTERSLRGLVGIDKTNSDTLSWLYTINSIGFNRETYTFDSSKRFLEWDIENINYQKNIIDNCLYTSRVHDLLDLRRQGNQLAGILLKRLVDRTTDEYESRFLLGKEKYLSFTDESLREYIKIKKWNLRHVQNNNEIKYWDVRMVTDMTSLFFYLVTNPLDLKYWDVSNVINMNSMFKNVKFNFTGIKNWNTKNVKDMGHMFEGLIYFNENIGSWNTSNVADMCGMFSGATSFNQNIGSWNTTSVTDMSYMFQGATSFNQDIGKWKTGNVWNMSHMFEGASSFNQNIGKWETGNVTDMSGMFQEAILFNQKIGTWDTANIQNMSYMFYKATYFNQDIGKWETSNVWDMSHMFQEARSFNQNIGKWKTGNVWDMSHMFEKAISFDQDIGTWKTGNVWNMSHMFEGATLFNQDIGTWETGNVENMSHMFRGATSFNQEIGTWDTNNVGDMTDMFKEATSFIKETPKCGIISAPYDEGPSRISSELHMMIPPTESETTFRGDRSRSLISMMYLLHKYPEYCVVIPPSADYIESSLYGWNELMLRWEEDFDIPYGFWDLIKECLQKNPKPNFIIMPFGFPRHANYLIYDSITKELERFDPNGFTPGEKYNPPNLDRKLKYLFNSNVQEGMIERVYTPLSFCPRRSFQALQSSEGEQKPGDPGGFCAAWCYWYADTRLSNPNKTRKQVVEMALKKFKDEPKSMTEYIRSYSVFIQKTGELLRKSNDPSSVFKSVIEKSKYS